MPQSSLQKATATVQQEERCRQPARACGMCSKQPL